MEEEIFTREYYVSMWASILNSYRLWGHDLTTLLKIIKRTNPSIYHVFNLMYTKENDSYITLQFDEEASFFYKKLSQLLPEGECLYTKLKVKALKQKNNILEFKEELMQQKFNYLIAILCFAEEFAFLPLDNKMITAKHNSISAHSDNIIFCAKKNSKTGLTHVKVTIPNEISFEYYSSLNPIK